MKKVKILISAASLIAVFMIVLLTGCGPDTPDRAEPQGNLVPNVMGMNYTDAVAVLEAAGLEVTAVGADASTILPHTNHDRTVMQGQVFRVNDETSPNYSDSHSVLTGLSRVAPEGRVVLTFATEDYIFVPPEPEPEPEQEIAPEPEAEPAPEPEQDVEQDYDSEYEPELEDEPSVELDESESEPDVSNGDSELIGTWNWMGMPYYVFEEDGSGTMGIALMSMSIRWWSPGQGLLSVCTTPDSCGNNCLAPQEWYYEISNNRLTMTSRQVAGLSYTYNRSN